MKKLLFTMMAAFAMMCAFSSTAMAQEDVVGYWKTIDDETNKPKSIVKIYEKNGKIYGDIVKLFRGPDEEQNPKCDECEGSRKDKPIIGMNILWGLEKDGDEYEDGEILDPANGKTYTAKIWRDGNVLKVRGYIGFLYRTQTWKPAKKP